MNWDRIAGEWKQMAANLKSKWAKLTDDDLTHIAAKKERLIGKIQERYGVVRGEAEKQVDEWLAKLPSPQGAHDRAGQHQGSHDRAGAENASHERGTRDRAAHDRVDSDTFARRDTDPLTSRR
jgi:uncharacterized protein YjbJ (UPF0337 family)